MAQRARASSKLFNAGKNTTLLSLELKLERKGRSKENDVWTPNSSFPVYLDILQQYPVYYSILQNVRKWSKVVRLADFEQTFE